jgi:uncharacterized membrane protein YkoI
MNTNLRRTIFASLVIALAMVSVTQAQERKIKRSQLPAAVEKTVAEQSQGATIKGFSTEIENGKRVYEAAMTVNGHTKDILIDAKGNVIEIEEEVAMDSLSQAVKDALTKAAGRGTIITIESLTKNGTLVAYEGHVKRGLKRFEIQVGPNGEKLAHPE